MWARSAHSRVRFIFFPKPAVVYATPKTKTERLLHSIPRQISLCTYTHIHTQSGSSLSKIVHPQIISQIRMSSCVCCRPMVSMKSIDNKSIFVSPRTRRLPIGGESLRQGSKFCGVGVRASMVDSTESSSDFAKRMERAWLISQVPSTL